MKKTSKNMVKAALLVGTIGVIAGSQFEVGTGDFIKDVEAAVDLPGVHKGNRIETIDMGTVSLSKNEGINNALIKLSKDGSQRVYTYFHDINYPNKMTTIIQGLSGPYEGYQSVQLWDVKNGKPTTIDLEGFGDSGWDYYRILVKPVIDRGPGSEFDKETKPPVATDGTTAGVSYRTHVQRDGWQPFVKSGKTSGTTGSAKRLEGIKLQFSDLDYEGDIEYQTHVQSYGWMDWRKNGQLSGTEGEAKRLEAIRIKLTGEVSKHYDVYYRVHAQSYGWLDWTQNGLSAGTAGLGKRLEAIEVKLVKKGEPAPGKTTTPYRSQTDVVTYSTHVEKVGWQDPVDDGAMSGTSGRGLRLEGIRINTNHKGNGSIRYSTHVEKVGWQNMVKNGEMSGTTGRKLRLEAIKIQLDGDLAAKNDVYYRVHAQTYGWLGWAKNGEPAGTEGLSKRLEGIEIKIYPKGSKGPEETWRDKFIKK